MLGNISIAKLSYCNLRTRWLSAELMEETNLFMSLIEAKFQAGSIVMKHVDYMVDYVLYVAKFNELFLFNN